MSDYGKNPAQNQFTDRELELIDEITITMADIVGHNSRRDYETPEKLNEAYMQLTSTRKGLDRLSLALNLIDMSGKEGVFHEQIQKKLTEISGRFLNYFTEGMILNPSRLSKLLKEFEEKGIFLCIKGKKNIKKQSPKSIPRKSKAGEGRRQGYPKVYELTSTVEDYIKILSNPQALDLINKRLVKHGSLEKAYDLIIENAFELFKTGDGRFYDFLEMFKAQFPDIDLTTMPDPKLFQQAINSTREQELEELRKEAVRHFLENPNASLFFIFSLTKLEDNG